MKIRTDVVEYFYFSLHLVQTEFKTSLRMQIAPFTTQDAQQCLSLCDSLLLHFKFGDG